MDKTFPGYSLDFIHSMISEASGRTSGWINDLELRSVFQPAFSLHYRSMMGCEASLRSLDEGGRPVSPQALFGPTRNFAETAMLDLLCAALHVRNYVKPAPPPGLLLLNLHPEVLLDSGNTARFLSELFRHHGLAGGKVMLDVPGAALGHAALGDAVAAYRQLGCLVAVDDFGADNNDLDTIWHVKPAVVKIDRTVTAAAASDTRPFQVLQKGVSLLHEMGILVLMEGLEQESEVLVALESDADFGSGFHLGAMHDSVAAIPESAGLLDGLWGKLARAPARGQAPSAADRSTLEDGVLRSSNVRKFRNASSEEIGRHREQRRPYLNAIHDLAARLQSGAGLEEAGREFLALPGAIRCYTLDGEGMQTAPAVMARVLPPRQGMDFQALYRNQTANWSRRDFFRRAVREPGVAQVTRRYCSPMGYAHCVTFSVAVRAGNRPLVVCCDVDWTHHAA
ncbi:MAG TPA: EAL domain-containing protein [Burkholderiales bacterium]|nr:EAL domain-containing protein [Burkholderiales bacterium]